MFQTTQEMTQMVQRIERMKENRLPRWYYIAKSGKRNRGRQAKT